MKRNSNTELENQERKVVIVIAKVSQGRQNTNVRQTTYRNSNYVAGNTVRKLDAQREIRTPQVQKVSDATRKNRERALHMNVGYVLFLTVAICMAGFILIGYIKIQSDITTSVKQIARLESRLNNLKMDNDEEYSRVLSSINLDEIKRIAIQELGMTYASEGQIITFATEEYDYVQQMGKIPTE